MDELIKAIVVTAEITGTDLSLTAAKVMAEDLAEFPAEQVMGALKKCRRSLSGRLTIEAVISRLDDGRLGPNEAWAMIPKDENSSVVWTDEMAQAFGVAYPLICEGDTIQARMAFNETYSRLCEQSREQKIPVKWTPSLGFDKRGRESALLDAVSKGRLTASHAASLLPYIEGSDAKQALLEMDETGKPIDMDKKIAAKREQKQLKLVGME